MLFNPSSVLPSFLIPCLMYFTSIQMNDTGSVDLFSCDLSLSDFASRVILNSENKLGSVSSSFICWKSF